MTFFYVIFGFLSILFFLSSWFIHIDGYLYPKKKKFFHVSFKKICGTLTTA